MSFGEMKKQAVDELFTAWRKLRSYGMEMFDAETYEKINIDDVVIDEEGAR